MIDVNAQPDYTNLLGTLPAVSPTVIPAGLVAVGDEVAFFYGAETVTAVEADDEGFVLVRFADVEPALYAAFDGVPVLRPTRERGR